MKYLIALCVGLLSVTSFHAQAVTNDVLKKRIAAARAEDSIALTTEGGATKIMAVTENFSREDSVRSGILAMTLAIGLVYPGDSLTKSPDSFLLTFWVLSKKPRFDANHSMIVTLKEEILVIGSARYVVKPREQMEYLNFEISRANLSKIAAESDVRLKLGDREFMFTRSQMKLFADVLVITEVEAGEQ
jgi:hypothetical protein